MVGRVRQDEAQVPPPVSEGAEVGRAVPLVGVQDHRYLCDPQLLVGGVGDHFRGEFHAGRAQAHTFECAAGKGPHAAVEVTD